MRVKELFRGHKELVLGFNTFLPKVSSMQQLLMALKLIYAAALTWCTPSCGSG